MSYMDGCPKWTVLFFVFIILQAGINQLTCIDNYIFAIASPIHLSMI